MRRGFTVLELVIAIAIVAILAGIAVPTYRGHIERHAEDAFERHVQRADDAAEVIAAMGNQTEADELEQRPVIGVRDEPERGTRQDPARGAPRRFEDELREFFRSRHPGILSEIRDTGKMPEGGEVENAIADFKAAFEGTGVEE